MPAIKTPRFLSALMCLCLAALLSACQSEKSLKYHHEYALPPIEWVQPHAMPIVELHTIGDALELIPSLILTIDQCNADKAALKKWREADRKSTRLNSSHVSISYAVFCLYTHK